MKKPIDRIRHLPPMSITPEKFRRLLDYSCSLPTGTTPGKVWRRHDGVFDRRPGAIGPVWMIGVYGAVIPARGREPEQIEIKWYRPVFRVKAGSAPHHG